MKRLLIIFLIPAASMLAQISPGDLTKFHEKLEGMSNCTKCHDLGKQLSNNNCIDCHTEIKERIRQDKGYHSSADVKGKNCWECHSEHNGRNFEIIRFDEKKFDHAKTGFQLTGSHAKLECGKCHKEDFIVNPELKKRKYTFLGLQTKCSSCHEDAHQGTLGVNCSGCHDTNKFKPAPKFSHDTAKFKLTGAHIKTQCDKCHYSEQLSGKQIKKFTGLKFGECLDCHKDVHKTKFGNDCTKCHSTESFKNIDKSSFNHDKTNFVLLGKHKTVECKKCHGSNLNSKPKHSLCSDCHTDFHKGEFAKNGKSNDCKDCHNENGFSPSLFTITKHNAAAFALSGSHLALPCKTCHFKTDNWKFKIDGAACINCHNNPHGNEISEKFFINSDCTICHTTAAWSEINFDHEKTKFVLAGKHKNVKCKNCHVKEIADGNKYKFRSLGTECTVCHTDIHNGQFISNMKNDCGRCHHPDNWNPVKFNHSSTRFPLTGAHAKVKCNQCHKLTERENKRFIKYKIEDITCAACHS